MIAEIINTIRKLGLENYGRYYSLYRANVFSNDDPQGTGRIQVVLPSISKKPLQEWANPVADYAGKKYGQFFPPEVGDCVWVAFECGDINYPLYMGGWWAPGETPIGFSTTRRGIRTKECELFFDDKDKIIGIKTPAASINLDDAAKTINIKTNGCELKLDESGKKIELTVSGGEVAITAANVVLDATSIKCGSGASKRVLLDGDKHFCVVTGAPVPTISTASKTTAE